MKNFKMTPHKLMIGLFALVLGGISLFTAILPKKEKSENENRYLADFPSAINEKKLETAKNPADVWNSVKWKYINDRSGHAFKDDFETYLSDHIVRREDWVKASNRIQTLSGKKEINGVYTLDNQMIQTFKEYNADDVNNSINAMNAFAERFPDKQMFFMLAPTVQEFCSGKIPSYEGLLSEKTFIDDCYKKLRNISAIDCRSFLASNSDEYIYYRTDHHWTSLGAYYAYQSAAKLLEYTAYGYGSFNIETASSDFRGTLYSKTLDDSIPADNIDYYTLSKNEPKVKMTCINGSEVKEYDSLYVRDFLNEKDKYSSFTGSNVPIVEIETDVDTDKTLLIIKDSYAHSLVPFLSKHYSKITMVDMRYINTSLNDLINLDDYSQVLFMYNAVTFAEDGNITKLGLTK
ncbi:MAG: DHHW family protein [Oscillospiraceae bacterium]|nr:DHHW family protein [Oscillospiraceae bacterium]